MTNYTWKRRYQKQRFVVVIIMIVVVGKTRFADPIYRVGRAEKGGVLVLNNFPFLLTDKCRTLNVKWKFKWDTPPPPPLSPSSSQPLHCALQMIMQKTQCGNHPIHLSIWAFTLVVGALSRIRWLTWRFATFFFASLAAMTEIIKVLSTHAINLICIWCVSSQTPSVSQLMNCGRILPTRQIILALCVIIISRVK